jgi:hypothetical protein
MGEKMGPNTFHALHAGADYMTELLELQNLSVNGAEVADASSPGVGVSGGGDVEAAALRAARLEALKQAASRSRFGGGVKLIDVGDWQREVVDQSTSKDGTWVVVHLQLDSCPQCAPLRHSLDAVSRRHPAVSFVSVAAAAMMPPSQFHNLPALFCYMEGKLHERLIGRELCAPGGPAPSPDEAEWLLGSLGVLATDQEAPPVRGARPPRRVGGAAAAGGSQRVSRLAKKEEEVGDDEGYTAEGCSGRGGGGARGGLGEQSDDEDEDDDGDGDGDANLGVD